MKRLVLFSRLVLLYLCVSPIIGAQFITQQGDLLAEMRTMTAKLPAKNTQGFIKPTIQEATDWRQLINLLIDGKTSDAQQLLATKFPFYEWVRFTDTGFENKTYEILREKSTGRKGWGALIWNPSSTRRLVFEAPHPIFDQNTDLESTDLFRRLGAWFLFVAGTNRCANTEKTPCSGTSSACTGILESYPISDVAHYMEAPFQFSHEEITKRSPRTYTFSIHGHGSTDCPDFFLSSGVISDPEWLAKSLQQRLHKDGLTAEYAGDGVTKCTLSGGSNVQGRFTNSATNACTTGANQATGYFMHIEQSSRVRSTSANYLKLADALQQMIPTAKEEDDPAFLFPFELNVYPNPAQTEITIRVRSTAPKYLSASVQNMLGQEMMTFWQEEMVQGEKQFALSVEHWAAGMYAFVIHHEHGKQTMLFTVVK